MFNQDSIELTKMLSKETKKSQGIYFTPKKSVKQVLDILEPYMKNIQTILEPSCGSGEFMEELVKYNKDLLGIEYNKDIYNQIKSKFNVINDDFLNHNKKYDLIIGNPPYYVMKKNDVKIHTEYIYGRPNIFILFIIHSLSLLNDYGIVSFIIPNSFLNSMYYSKLREMIYNNYNIISIDECKGGFAETKQDTIILSIQKSAPIDNHEYSYKYNFNTKEKIQSMIRLYTDSTTINELGGKVSIGTVVWNEVKDKLTNDSTKTRLIYSSDIILNELSIVKYNNITKKNYIDKEGKNETTIIVNRGYGSSKYEFKYCLVNTRNYLLENHILEIKVDDKYHEKILESFRDPRTDEFIRLFFGNNAISANELQYLFPIYIELHKNE